jgi:hypothetical protein
MLFASALAPGIFFGALSRAWRLGGDTQTVLYIIASLVTCFLPILIIRAALQKSSQIPFKAKKIKSQEWFLVVLIVAYILPIATKVDDLEVFTLVFIVTAVVLAKLDSIPNHPVLHIFNYRFYEVEGDNGNVYMLITRRKLLNASDLKIVRQLSPQLLLDA